MSPSVQYPSRSAETQQVASLAEFGATRLLAESLPLAAVLALWAALAELAGGGLPTTGVRLAGLSMAGAYALVRSRHLVAGAAADALPLAPRSLVRANAAPAIACLAWVLLGELFETLIRTLVFDLVSLGLPQRFGVFLDDVAEVWGVVGAAAGLLSVVLYAAVVVRLHAADDGTSRRRTRS